MGLGFVETVWRSRWAMVARGDVEAAVAAEAAAGEDSFLLLSMACWVLYISVRMTFYSSVNTNRRSPYRGGRSPPRRGRSRSKSGGRGRSRWAFLLSLTCFFLVSENCGETWFYAGAREEAAGVRHTGAWAGEGTGAGTEASPGAPHPRRGAGEWAVWFLKVFQSVVNSTFICPLMWDKS